MGLTLREGNREFFYRQLDKNFPTLKEKYIRNYGLRYQVTSPDNNKLMELFHSLCEKNGIMHDNNQIFNYLKTYEVKEDYFQPSLFD